jgi:hypothetical protein
MCEDLQRSMMCVTDNKLSKTQCMLVRSTQKLTKCWKINIVVNNHAIEYLQE